MKKFYLKYFIFLNYLNTLKAMIINLIFKFLKKFKPKSQLILNLSTTINTLNNNGYAYLRNYYTESEINYLNKIVDNILNEKDEKKLKFLRFEKFNQSLKIKNVQAVYNELKLFSKNIFFVMISFLFNFKISSNTFILNLTNYNNYNQESGFQSIKQIAGSPHIDYPNKNILKLIIFLEDVNLENGPTAVIPNSKKDPELLNLYAHLKANPGQEDYIDIKKFLGNTKYDKIINSKTTHFITGKKGDIVFIDTANIHWATILNKGHRKIFWVFF